MRLEPSPSRRGGFTLIELLVVIAILALLVALTAAGIGRVRSSQQFESSASTVRKGQVAIDQQLKATSDDANKPGNPHVALLLPFCDNDMDRAKALAFYAYAKKSFPQTFTEAKAGVTISGITLADATFSKFPLSAASGLTPAQESAVILHTIVTSMAKRGMNQTEEAFSGATMSIPGNGVDYTVLKDAYGTPIAMYRWYVSPELQNPPYINAKPDAGQADPANPSKDRFDPLGKLALSSWPISGTGNRTLALGVLNSPAGFAPAVNFDRQNKIIAVISAGPDRKFGPVFGGALADGDDDIYGFRVMQLGASGN